MNVFLSYNRRLHTFSWAYLCVALAVFFVWQFVLPYFFLKGPGSAYSAEDHSSEIVPTCKGTDVFLLVYVLSSPENLKRRTAIRQTWGNQTFSPGIVTQVMFVIGRPKDTDIQNYLELEAMFYHDVLQLSFVDKYRLLTHKNIGALKWITFHCAHAQFVLKTDDDSFVNMFELISELKKATKPHNVLTNSFLCCIWYDNKPIRKRTHKWFVSEEEYGEKYYPTQCSGQGYIMTGDLVPELYNASLTTPVLFVEDVYVSGILGRAVHAMHKEWNHLYVYEWSHHPSVKDVLNRMDKWIFVNPVWVKDTYVLWKSILQKRENLSTANRIESLVDLVN